MTMLAHLQAFSRRIKTLRQFKPDGKRDVFLVSYPRSGNTWVRAIIAGILFSKPPDSLAELANYVPDIHRLPPRRHVLPAEFYVIKSHEPYAPGPHEFGKYHRAIYLIRHPLDVLLSYYRYMSYVAGYEGKVRDFSSEWVQGEVWPGQWSAHVESWFRWRDETGAQEQQFLFLRYEDLLADAPKQIGRIARFLGKDLSAEELEALDWACRPEAMREREASGVRKGLQVEGFKFIGTARSDNWKNEHDFRAAVDIPPELKKRAAEFGYAFE
jgi:hypothetical protein